MRIILLILLTGILAAESDDTLSKASKALKAGLYKDALSLVIEAHQSDQDNPEIFRLKALLHETLDEPNEALTAWKSCLKYSKDELLSEEAMIHIQSLILE